ncbi:MAG: lysostaphin resistance A-like protein [Marinifilaceae bacterium]
MEIEKEIFQGVTPKAYPTIAQGWGIMGYFLLIGMLLMIPIGLLSFVGIDPKTDWFLFLTYCIPMLILLWITSAYRKKNISNRKGYSFRRIPLSLFPVLIGVTIALIILLEPLSSIIPSPDWLKELMNSGIILNYWGFLTLAVAAPILEELLMRGVVLEGLLQNYEPRKAIIWSAVFFGVLHMNLAQFVGAFLIGIVIGWLYWKTDSLWPGILIHFVNNSLAFAGMVYFPDSEGIFFYDLVGNPLLYGLLLLVCVAIVWVTYKYVQSVCEKRGNVAVNC